MTVDIGLPLDTADVLALPPSVVVYGAPGAGKSMEMARAFPKALYIQSSPNILKAYAHWAQQQKVPPPLPTRVTLDETTLQKHYGGSTIVAITTVLQKYIAACDAGNCPYEGIIWDEWNVFCERLYEELKTDPWGKFKGKGGNLNIFAVMDAFKAIHRQVLSINRRTRRMMGFVAHYQQPKYDEEENSASRGSLKWPGGPKMPMGLGDQVVAISAEADAVVHLTVKEDKTLSLSNEVKEPQRVFLTQLEQKWFRKVRGAPGCVAPEEPCDLASGKGLREMLARAGFPV